MLLLLGIISSDTEIHWHHLVRSVTQPIFPLLSSDRRVSRSGIDELQRWPGSVVKPAPRYTNY